MRFGQFTCKMNIHGWECSDHLNKEVCFYCRHWRKSNVLHFPTDDE